MPLPDEGGDRKAGDDRVTQGGQSLGDALAWLDRHVNLEAIERGIAGRAAEPTLERIATLVAAMDDPQASYPVVHVTGTNGKGSTSRLTAQLLMGQGLTVGTYTSPHLETVNERIALDGVPITDGALANLLGPLQDLEEFLLRRPGGLTMAPTWFELVTAAAYRHFADVAVDAAVVEVGIGGLYDATNVADGVVAVLTNVSLDHVEILGPSVEAIAREKAGIVKPGAIVVLGEDDESVVGIVAEEARRVGAAAVWRRGVDFDCVANRVAHGGRLLDLRTPGASYDDVYVPLHGAHQGDNAAAALAAAEAFFAAPLDEGVVAAAFARTTAPGRLEVVGRRPLVVLDGAHNAAGAHALAAALEEDFAAARVVVVLGCLRGRDPAELLDALGRERLAHVVACAPPSPRALPAEEVAAAASGCGVEVTRSESVEAALGLALGAAGRDDIVLVTGSLYLVGAARTLLRRSPLG
ncbi:MAG TPA: Mur ligase family protein [Acidimicrobiales bacterium]|nr:Mur ligase family protein [Acidimicrobiales bacterium]